jgi:hypothetical protein
MVRPGSLGDGRGFFMRSPSAHTFSGVVMDESPKAHKMTIRRHGVGPRPQGSHSN